MKEIDYDIEECLDIFERIGLDENERLECSMLLKEGKEEHVKKILCGHRKNILESIHLEEKKIEILDYFLYKVIKN